jgi:hypothetical protein
LGIPLHLTVNHFRNRPRADETAVDPGADSDTPTPTVDADSISHGTDNILADDGVEPPSQVAGADTGVAGPWQWSILSFEASIGSANHPSSLRALDVVVPDGIALVTIRCVPVRTYTQPEEQALREDFMSSLLNRARASAGAKLFLADRSFEMSGDSGNSAAAPRGTNPCLAMINTSGFQSAIPTRAGLIGFVGDAPVEATLVFPYDPQDRSLTVVFDPLLVKQNVAQAQIYLDANNALSSVEYTNSGIQTATED